MRVRNEKRLSRILRTRWMAFTLAELIVVVTILAILATIGFLALSGYSQDAKDSAIKANVRSVQTAISSEAALTNNSPRYYVVHDTGAALSGAFVYVDGNQTALTGGDWNVSGTNYSAGNPDYAKLKLNRDKFKVGFEIPHRRGYGSGAQGDGGRQIANRFVFPGRGDFAHDGLGGGFR
ncbi:MAG: prepilin-type N-terminal cleavage/methylation domain-containing protein [Patescibacteria group bacterium]